jgi:apolipoprotein N-acyltransferase
VLGYTQHDGGPLLPLARGLGVLGVSAACAVIAVCLEALGRRVLSGTGSRGLSWVGIRAATWPPVAVVAVVLVLAPVLGGSPPPADGDTIDVASVQGNQIQATSAAGTSREDVGRIVRVAEQMVAATRPLAEDPPALTVWPENSVDADVRDPENTGVREALDEALDLVEGGPMLIGGHFDGPRPRTRYNVVYEVHDDIQPEGVYYKRHPVPMGEYIPGRSLLEWFPPLDQIPSDVLPGDDATVIDVAGARVGAAICFENVFPELLRSQVREGADLLLVATNNASFGRTPMSRQHLAISQVRAVETGRWVLHAGISGISAVIDPTGGTSQETALYEAAIVRADLPLISGITLAMRLSGWFEGAVVVLGLGALVVLVASTGRRRVASRWPAR